MNTLENPEHPARTPSRYATAFQQVLRERFAVPFTCYDAVTGVEVPTASDPVPCRVELDAQAVIQLAAAGRARVEPHGGNHFRISLVLHAAGKPIVVAAGLIPALAESAAARAQERERLQFWADDFCERLRLGDDMSARAKAEADLRGQVSRAWQVNLSLGECMRRLRFNRHEVRDRERILEAALNFQDAQALLWVPTSPGQEVLIIGQAIVTRAGASRLMEFLSRNPASPKSEPIFCNDPRDSPWGGEFPQIDSLMAFRVLGPSSAGWVMVLNKRGKVHSRAAGAPPKARFRDSDAAQLSPFVTMLEMQCTASTRFDELRSLLVGLARALTAAIDAKDSYTAGHSERVARLACEIGRELGLPHEQLSDTYLAGLLHDVGKIGVREAVLSKPDRLTPEEFEHMKRHVTIGYHILQDLEPIGHLLPGVLYHHERFDGQGYPEGLAGDKIPILARLLAVADAFDAMNSTRPYRPALSLDRIFEEFKKGSGTQWDAQVVAAALKCAPRLVAITSRGLGESLRQAVDSALRVGESSWLVET